MFRCVMHAAILCMLHAVLYLRERLPERCGTIHRYDTSYLVHISAPGVFVPQLAKKKMLDFVPCVGGGWGAGVRAGAVAC